MLSSSDNNEDSNKRRRVSPISPLLIYPFLMPLLRRYLDDEDVLTRLLLTGNAIKPELDNWLVTNRIDVDLARTITRWGRYAQVIVKHISEYQGEDLGRHPALESLETDETFNKSLEQGDLPLSLIELILSKSFNRQIRPGVLPPQLEILHFGDCFNRPLLPDSLPVRLNELYFGDSFNQSLTPGVIPVFVTTLHFGDVFNQPLQPGVLPPRLKNLVLGKHFNQPLSADVMPPCLESLIFRDGSKFGNSLFLPSTLRELDLTSSLSGIQLAGPLPASLVDLSLGPDTQPLPAGLLPALSEVAIDQPVIAGSIPVGITELSYHANDPIPAGAIPKTVTRLHLIGQYNRQVLADVIPDSVTHLVFGDAFNQFVLPRSIPSSVTHIAFGRGFNQMLVPGVLPESVVCLCMDRAQGVFNQLLLAVDASMPSTSLSLTIRSIPHSVTHLVLSRSFNQPLHSGSIPPSVTHLAIGSKFTQPLSSDELPPALSQLLLATGGAVYVSDDVMAHAKEDDSEHHNWWT